MEFHPYFYDEVNCWMRTVIDAVYDPDDLWSKQSAEELVVDFENWRETHRDNFYISLAQFVPIRAVKKKLADGLFPNEDINDTLPQHASSSMFRSTAHNHYCVGRCLGSFGRGAQWNRE